LYGHKAMQVLVDGEERYFSTRERYMKSKETAGRNAEVFTIALACDKGVYAQVRSLCVTDCDADEPVQLWTPALREAIKGNEAAPQDEKPTFEACIARLPEALHAEVLAMDAFLREMRPLKFRRQIEAHGNKITYVAASEGLSYAICPSNDTLHHSLNWYIVTSGKPETWARTSVCLSGHAPAGEPLLVRITSSPGVTGVCFGSSAARVASATKPPAAQRTSSANPALK
jgi:hypothetical protein